MGWFCFGLAGLFVLLMMSAGKDKPAAPSDDAPPSAMKLVDGKRVLSLSETGSSLSVSTQPDGASLLLNGRLIGATPISINGLTPGSYAMRLEHNSCAPLIRTVVIGKELAVISEKLLPLPVGSLRVDIKPIGAEVLIDGELLGHTPLQADTVPAGIYELLIRKSNFEPYTARIEVEFGQPLVFAEFELKDKVFAMLDGLIKSEPQRVGHYIDLGHYLFVNDRLDDSVDVFLQGMEVLQTPLDFTPAPSTDKTPPVQMSDAEIALEQRLRKEDESRFMKELEKHRNWPRGKGAQEFRALLEKKQETVGRKNVTSFAWAEQSARMQLRNRNYDGAARLYRDHIAAAPQGPDLYKAYVALMDVSLMQRDVVKAREAFDAFLPLFNDNGPALRLCGSTLYQYQERVSIKSRPQLLEMSQKALRRGLELTVLPAEKAQCLYDLGMVLRHADQAKDAVPYLEQSVALTTDVLLQEERMLRLADALYRADRLDEATTLYTKLTSSERTQIREGARTGQLYVTSAKMKKTKK